MGVLYSRATIVVFENQIRVRLRAIERAMRYDKTDYIFSYKFLI